MLSRLPSAPARRPSTAAQGGQRSCRPPASSSHLRLLRPTGSFLSVLRGPSQGTPPQSLPEAFQNGITPCLGWGAAPLVGERPRPPQNLAPGGVSSRQVFAGLSADLRSDPRGHPCCSRAESGPGSQEPCAQGTRDRPARAVCFWLAILGADGWDEAHWGSGRCRRGCALPAPPPHAALAAAEPRLCPRLISGSPILQPLPCCPSPFLRPGHRRVLPAPLASPAALARSRRLLSRGTSRRSDREMRRCPLRARSPSPGGRDVG